MLLRMAEIFGGLLIGIILVVQLVIPAWRGQKLFPFFRKQGKLEKELAKEVQRQEEGKVKESISKLRARNRKESRK